MCIDIVGHYVDWVVMQQHAHALVRCVAHIQQMYVVESAAVLPQHCMALLHNAYMLQAAEVTHMIMLLFSRVICWIYIEHTHNTDYIATIRTCIHQAYTDTPTQFPISMCWVLKPCVYTLLPLTYTVWSLASQALPQTRYIAEQLLLSPSDHDVHVRVCCDLMGLISGSGYTTLMSQAQADTVLLCISVMAHIPITTLLLPAVRTVHVQMFNTALLLASMAHTAAGTHVQMYVVLSMWCLICVPQCQCTSAWSFVFNVTAMLSLCRQACTRVYPQHTICFMVVAAAVGANAVC